MRYIFVLSFIVFAASFTACNGNRPERAVEHSGRIVQWRNDRTGIFHETGLKTSWLENEPALLWQFDGLGYGHSSPVIANGRIFVTGMNEGIGTIFAFDLNGRLLNQREYGAEWDRNFDGSRGTITPSNGKLYFISGMGVLYCFDAHSLEEVWSLNLLEEFDAPNIVWGISESPLIVGDKVVVTPGGAEHNVVALNKHHGELIWSTPGMGSQSAYCSALFIGEQEIPLIVQMTGLYTIGIHADTGEMLWAHSKANRHQVHGNTPLYSNNMLLLTSGDGRGSTMLRLLHGGREVEEVWFSETLSNTHGGMVKIGNYVFGSDNVSRTWFCVNWYTGEVMWRESGPAPGVIIANKDMLYIYSTDGNIVLAKATPSAFNIVGDISLGEDQHWAHPILYNGMLIVRHNNRLMAFDIKNR